MTLLRNADPAFDESVGDQGCRRQKPAMLIVPDGFATS